MRPPHLRSFRKSLTWSGVILFGLAVAARAMAEVSTPRVSDSSNNHARFSAVAQYQEKRSLDWFLANRDPNIAEMKVRNPELLYEGNWRSQVPALQPLGATSVRVAGVGLAKICSEVDGPGEQ